jgi:hypothetical protein
MYSPNAPRVSPPPAKRWGGVGGGGCRRGRSFRDHFEHAVDIRHHVIVPKSQHAVAVRPQIFISLRITRRLRRFAMLSAIQFNRETPRMARKVDKVRSDRRLPAKMRTVHRKATKPSPQFAFSIGRVASQLASSWHPSIRFTQRTHSSVLVEPPPTPDPSPPLRGERGAREPALLKVSYGCRRTSAACRCACRRRTRPLRISPP